MGGQQPEQRIMSKPVKIIMVEDDEGHARLIERNIRRSGVNNEIVPFTNGTEAVNYLFGQDGTTSARKGQALLILLDLNLPDMTGIDILKRVKENKFLKATPVVVLTTTDDSQEIKRCRTPVMSCSSASIPVVEQYADHPIPRSSKRST